MNVSVYGLGYVGCVSAVCLAHLGHYVIGVDVSEGKVALVNQGKSPLVEPGLDDMLRFMVADGRIRATTDSDEAIENTELSLICESSRIFSSRCLLRVRSCVNARR